MHSCKADDMSLTVRYVSLHKTIHIYNFHSLMGTCWSPSPACHPSQLNVQTMRSGLQACTLTPAQDSFQSLRLLDCCTAIPHAASRTVHFFPVRHKEPFLDQPPLSHSHWVQQNFPLLLWQSPLPTFDSLFTPYLSPKLGSVAMNGPILAKGILKCVNSCWRFYLRT